MDEAQLSALISAAVKEAVERTARELAAKHEADTEGLRRKRDELLDKVAKKDGSALENFDEWLAGSAERLRKSNELADRLLGKSAKPDAAPKQTEVTITRDEARSGSAYRAAKAEAEAKGLPLRIVDERATAPVAGSRVKYVSDDASRTVYANKEIIREAGGFQRLKETVERDGKRVVVFRSVDDLPSHLHRAHAETLAANKPDTLLEGGE